VLVACLFRFQVYNGLPRPLYRGVSNHHIRAGQDDQARFGGPRRQTIPAYREEISRASTLREEPGSMSTSQPLVCAAWYLVGR